MGRLCLQLEVVESAAAVKSSAHDQQGTTSRSSNDTSSASTSSGGSGNIVRNKRLEKLVEFSDGHLRLGRNEGSNALVIQESAVSRCHCEFTAAAGGAGGAGLVAGSGRFFVRDLGSTTGTFLLLRPHVPLRLFKGLLLKFGQSEVVVVDTNPETCELFFFEGPLQGKQISVQSPGGEPFLLGRLSPELPALNNDGTLSGQHAVIQFDRNDGSVNEAGAWTVTDLGSSNGTSCRLSVERETSATHAVFNGDVLQLGCTRVRCVVGELRDEQDHAVESSPPPPRVAGNGIARGRTRTAASGAGRASSRSMESYGSAIDTILHVAGAA